MGSVGGWLEPFLPDYVACIVYHQYSPHTHNQAAHIFVVCEYLYFFLFSITIFFPNSCDSFFGDLSEFLCDFCVAVYLILSSLQRSDFFERFNTKAIVLKWCDILFLMPSVSVCSGK